MADSVHGQESGLHAVCHGYSGAGIQDLAAGARKLAPNLTFRRYLGVVSCAARGPGERVLD
jgi:hypothetical protein